MRSRESGLPCGLPASVGRWADGKWIAGANGHLLRGWRGILAGFVPGIAETFSLSAGRSRLAGLQGVERAAAPAGVVNALYAIRVLRNARLSPRRAGDAEADRRGQQRARQLNAITHSCGNRRADHSRSHNGNPLHTADTLSACKKLAMRFRPEVSRSPRQRRENRPAGWNAWVTFAIRHPRPERLRR
jgi:hypothetical protein